METENDVKWGPLMQKGLGHNVHVLMKTMSC